MGTKIIALLLILVLAAGCIEKEPGSFKIPTGNDSSSVSPIMESKLHGRITQSEGLAVGIRVLESVGGQGG